MAGNRTAPEVEAFVRLVGREAWQARIEQIIAAQPVVGQPTLCGREVLRRHSIEVAIERQRRPGSRAVGGADARILELAGDACRLHASLPEAGRRRLQARLEAAMLDGQSLASLFHLLRTAWLHRHRGFEVTFAGLSEAAPFDLHLTRGDGRAAVACETLSAERGRGVHRAAWFRLVDAVAPAARSWLARHPGRHLLKMTLPSGLTLADGEASVATLAERIGALLADGRRSDADAVAVMRVDPLARFARTATEADMLAGLRADFGPDTQLAVVALHEVGALAMAAHAGRENDVPLALRERMIEAAPDRLCGRLPGILAMYVDDIERSEWQRLQRELLLEAEARHFLTMEAARHVVSVACTSRHELFDRSVADGEFRFRNPRHIAAREVSLGPSILSSN